jgi:hypothetical protein
MVKYESRDSIRWEVDEEGRFQRPVPDFERNNKLLSLDIKTLITGAVSSALFFGHRTLQEILTAPTDKVWKIYVPKIQ